VPVEREPGETAYDALRRALGTSQHGRLADGV
jgi:hypothetical protein